MGHSGRDLSVNIYAKNEVTTWDSGRHFAVQVVTSQRSSLLWCVTTRKSTVRSFYKHTHTHTRTHTHTQNLYYVVVRPMFPMMTITSSMMIMMSFWLTMWVRRWLISPILACSTLPHSGHGYVGPTEALVVE